MLKGITKLPSRSLRGASKPESPIRSAILICTPISEEPNWNSENLEKAQEYYQSALDEDDTDVRNT